ncbi:helix-turn-helix domain-containing protein [Delftia acidovorans]|uniref:HTH cro/C1-type domain-containing protein n=1 Tax=Chryseobacterium sp. B5 TaxID=2050562 RepID=A0A2G7TA59_9FLAO|nr:helix-turn-helix domain-containing protein [Delftia acidovorans]
MNHDSKKLFGQRLKAARTKVTLSQDDLAEALQVTRQTISKWERGESSPTAQQLAGLAAMCCACAHTLLFGEPYRQLAIGELIQARGVEAVKEDRTNGCNAADRDDQGAQRAASQAPFRDRRVCGGGGEAIPKADAGGDRRPGGAGRIGQPALYSVGPRSQLG